MFVGRKVEKKKKKKKKKRKKREKDYLDRACNTQLLFLFLFFVFCFFYPSLEDHLSLLQ